MKIGGTDGGRVEGVTRLTDPRVEGGWSVHGMGC